MLWATGRWTIHECLRFLGIVFCVLIIAIFIKVSLSTAWEIPEKVIASDFITTFLENMKAYPRVVGDALQPISLRNFLIIVVAIVFLSLALGGDYRRVGALCGSLFVGLVSSALLYAVVGYGISGIGVMARTLAAQNVYFSLFIGISMMPALTKLRSLERGNFRGVVIDVVLPLLWCAFATLIVILATAAARRSNEWSGLWQSEVSVLKRFPVASLARDIGSLDHTQETAVIVQIDADTRGDIFGAPWEIGPALIWMYPELKSDVEKVIG